MQGFSDVPLRLAATHQYREKNAGSATLWFEGHNSYTVQRPTLNFPSFKKYVIQGTSKCMEEKLSETPCSPRAIIHSAKKFV